MPYPRAHLAVLTVLGVTIFAFWPSYFTILGDAPLAFHVHGITASAWMLLVAFQSWSIHRGRRSLHRTTGLASLVIFPVFTASLVMIVNVSAAGYQAGSPYYQVAGPPIGFATLVPLLVYPVLFFYALRERRTVWLHAGWMLSTVFFLWEPAASRLLVRYVPALAIAGPEDFHKVAEAIAWGSAMAVPVAVYLYLRNREHGIPFLVVAASLALQVAGTVWLADTALWRGWFDAYGQLPPVLTVGAGLLLGVAAVWLGWRRPAERRPRAAPA